MKNDSNLFFTCSLIEILAESRGENGQRSYLN